MNIWMLLLLFAAGLFLVYPFVRSGSNDDHTEGSGDSPAEGAESPEVDDGYTAKNVELYREQLKLLQQQLDNGDISQQQYADVEQELQQQLLLDSPQSADTDNAGISGNGRWLVMLCLILLPLMSVGLYFSLGASEDVELARLLSEPPEEELSAEEFEQLRADIVAKITNRLSSGDIDDERSKVAYLVTAARLNLEQGEFVAAAGNYQQVVAIYPADPMMLAEYAQASYFASGNTFTPVVTQAVEQSLAIDPANETALGLQGIGHFGKGNYQQAINSWQLALGRLPSGSAQGKALISGIVRARKLIVEAGGVVDTAEIVRGAEAVVYVTVSPELTVSPDQVVYVFAREWQGMPLPLAVAKLTVADLPTEVILNDQMAMPGGKSLSSVKQIQLVVRVSSSGSVQKQAGDLQGESTPMTLAQAAEGIKLEVDTRL